MGVLLGCTTVHECVMCIGMKSGCSVLLDVPPALPRNLGPS